MLFAANIALDQEVIMADIVLALYIYTLLTYTNTYFHRSRHLQNKRHLPTYVRFCCLLSHCS